MKVYQCSLHGDLSCPVLSCPVLTFFPTCPFFLHVLFSYLSLFSCESLPLRNPHVFLLFTASMEHSSVVVNHCLTAMFSSNLSSSVYVRFAKSTLLVKL